MVTHDPAVAQLAERELHLLDGRWVDHLNGREGGYASAPLSPQKMEGVLTIGPGAGLVIVGSAVGLTLLAALSTAWGPTSLRPAVVLNDRG